MAPERYRTDAALRESERRLSTLMSNLPGMAYRCVDNPQWDMEFVSQGSADLTGYEPEELISSRRVAYGDLVHREDAERVWHEVESAVMERRPFQMTYRIRTADGDEKWVWERGRGVYGDDGAVLALEGFICDITERVAVEQLLEQRIDRRTHELSALLDVSTNMISTLDLEPLLQLILEQLYSVIDYDAASILILEKGADEAEELRMVAHRGPISDKDALQIRFPLGGDSAAGAIISQREPVVIPDVRSVEPSAGPLVAAFRRAVGAHLDSTFKYVRSWLGVPLVAKGRVLGMLTLDHREPEAYSAAHSRLALTFANQVAVAIEHAQLYRAAERRADEAQTLFDIQQAIARRLDEQGVLQLIADGARRLTGAQGVAVLLLEEDPHDASAWLRIVVTSGEVAESTSGMRLPLSGSLMGQTFGSGAPLYVDHAQFDPYRQPGTRRGQAIRQEDGHSLLIVPLVTERGPLGAISLSDAALLHATEQVRPDRGGMRIGSLNEEDRQLLMLLASSAVIGLDNARLYAEVQQTAVREERNRLARDLHDSVTQSLYSVTLFAEASATLLAAGDYATATKHLVDLRDTAQEALREMRLLIFELRSPALEEDGLSAVLQERLEAVEARGGIRSAVQVTGEESLPVDVQEELYHMAQEILNNVLKHARAERVDVYLDYTASSASLRIEDNGVGFDTAQVRRGRLGLAGLRERAARIGAQLTLESSPGHGTCVTVSVALPRSVSIQQDTTEIGFDHGR